ncbi:MAG TPA: hypothetical protein VNI61_00795, partial [Gemmatimonadales bacterium]|nr:hypothetical protein [Gemmatimonadales bacterium]
SPAREARQARDLLRACGYQPAGAEGGAIRLRNCPFDRLAREQRALVCGMNLALLEGVVAGLALRSVRAAADPQPGCCCVALRPRGGGRGRAPKLGAG